MGRRSLAPYWPEVNDEQRIEKTKNYKDMFYDVFNDILLEFYGALVNRLRVSYCRRFRPCGAWDPEVWCFDCCLRLEELGFQL